MSKEYIIVAPTLSRSAGVRVLYLLHMHLEKRGYRVSMVTPGLQVPGFNYINFITPEMQENAIVVYPEIIFGNPLGIKNVVRFVLNYPGLLGGSESYHPSEFIVTHNKLFYPEAMKLTIPLIDQNKFYDNNSKKTQNCYFVYKGGKFREVPELEGCVEINMAYPDSKEELAELLRTTEILYSYDDCSSLLDEAMLCGAKVKIITEDGFATYNGNYKEQVANFEEEIANFIELTQQLNYTGPIEVLQPAPVS